MRKNFIKQIAIILSSVMIVQNISELSVISNINTVNATEVIIADKDISEPSNSTGITVTTQTEFMNALSQKKSPITVSGSITLGDEATSTGKMIPVKIPEGTTIQGAANASLDCRCPIQIEGDGVIIKNIKMTFSSSDALGSVPHREIFLAGYSLTLDNVNTYLDASGGTLGGFGGSEEELLPTVYGGAFEGTANIGSKAELIIINANENTKFKAIYMGNNVGTDSKVAYSGESALKLCPKVSVTEGVYTDLNSSSSIEASGTGNLNNLVFYGNDNTELTVRQTTLNNTGVYGAGSLILDDNAWFLLTSGDLCNVELRNGACLDLNGMTEVFLSGDFTGMSDDANTTETDERGILVLNENGLLTIQGIVSGDTLFHTDNKNFTGKYVYDRKYIIAENVKTGDRGFYIPDEKQSSYDFVYETDGWIIKEPEYPTVGSIEIIDFPQSVDISKIIPLNYDPSEQAPYCEIIWKDENGYEINSELADRMELYTFFYVVVIKTEYWRDESILDVDDWSAYFEFTTLENEPGKYYFYLDENFADYQTSGEYTFLFLGEFPEYDLDTIEDIRAIKTNIKAEMDVYFYDSSKGEFPNLIDINSDDITVSEISKQEYTGEEIKPEVIIMDGEKQLEEGTDYELSYSSNIEVGVATVTITGIGKYEGTREITFEIIKNTPPETETETQTSTETETETETKTSTETETETETKTSTETETETETKTSTETETETKTSTETETETKTSTETETETETKTSTETETDSETKTSTETETETETKTSTETETETETKTSTETETETETKTSTETETETETKTSTETETETETETKTSTETETETETKTSTETETETETKTSTETETETETKTSTETETEAETETETNTSTETETETEIETETETETETEKESEVIIPEKNNLWIKFSEDTQTYTYNGKAIKPVVEVYEGHSLLTSNDYEILYKNNIKAGTATIIVKGKGNYTGSDTVEFIINPKEISDEDIITNDVYSLIKNGSVKNPKILLKYNNKSLKESIDYKFEYPEMLKDENGNIIPQTLKISVTGYGNFTGTRDITYNVLSNDIRVMSDVRISASSKNINYFEKKLPEFTLTYGSGKTKEILTPEDDYTIIYPDLFVPGKNIITFAAKEGSGYYGTKTFTVNVTGKPIKSKDIVIENVKAYYDYTGFEVRNGQDGLDEIVVKDAGKILKENIDYVLSYKNNVRAGKATVTISGKGGYTGSRSISFNINKAKLSDEMFDVSDTAVYTKNGAKPEITAKYNNIILTEKKDYTVTYQNNKKAGNNTATIKITGKGNFTGELKKTFSVVASNADNIVFTVNDTFVPKTVSKLKPKISVTEASTNKKLTAGKDYNKKIEYFIAGEDGVLRPITNDDLKSGAIITARLTIVEGSLYDNNLQDNTPVTKETTFRLYSVKPSAVQIEKVAVQTYTGKQITPKLTVKYNGKVLQEYDETTKTGDYIISYSNNVNIGTAKAVVTFVSGDLGGTKTVKFKIIKKDMQIK